MKYLPIFLLLISCTKPDYKEVYWGNESIILENNIWVLKDNGIEYPLDQEALESLLSDFKKTNLVKISRVDYSVMEYYGFSNNRINNYLIGSKLPGELGRYIYNLDSMILYRGFGDLSEFSFFYSFKDLSLGKKLEVGEPLYISIDNNILLGEDAILYFNNLLRVDVDNLIENSGDTIFNGVIKYTNGEEVIFYIKKGEQGYSVNLGSPYSYKILSEDFKIISSF